MTWKTRPGYERGTCAKPCKLWPRMPHHLRFEAMARYDVEGGSRRGRLANVPIQTLRETPRPDFDHRRDDLGGARPLCGGNLEPRRRRRPCLAAGWQLSWRAGR